MRYLFIFLNFLCLTVLAQTPNNQAVFQIDSLPKQGILLDKGWKWHAGDNLNFAKSDFDDSAWESINPIFTVPELKQVNTNSPLWLRIKLHSTHTKTIALAIKQSCASEIFLNGKLVKSFGKIDINKQNTVAYTPVDEYLILDLEAAENTLAVRQYFQEGIRYKQFHDISYSVFTCFIFNADHLPIYPHNDSFIWEGFNIGVPFILFLVYFTIFLFYTPNKSNLWFSLWGLCNATTGFLVLLTKFTPQIALQNQYTAWGLISSSFSTISLLYSIALLLHQKQKKLLLVFVGTSIMSILYYFFRNGIDQRIVDTFVFLFYIGMVDFMSVKAIKQGNRGGIYVIIGMAFYIIFWTVFLFDLSGFDKSTVISGIIFHIAVLSLPIIVAALLGLEFRNSNKTLLKNIEDIKSLSAEKQQILATQNETLEKQVTERTAELKHKNRDLEIEGALEKIRSTSLAMNHSGEIKNVVTVLFEKLKELNLVFDAAAIHVFKEGTKNASIWVASPEQLSSATEINLPYDTNAFVNNPIILDVWNAKETGNHIFNKIYPFEEKNRYFNYVFKHNDFGKIPEFVRNVILNADSYTASFVSEKNSLLGVNSWKRELFSKTDFEILKRVARVFEQSYTRFLDLQKAEAQAREAQIEAALERVRSASLAMHQSADLIKVVEVLFDKLKYLNLTFDSAFIYLFEKPKRNIEAWVASKQLSAPIKVNLPYDEDVANNPIIVDLWYAIENGEHGLNKSYKEKDKDDYYRYEAKYNQSLIPESVTDIQLQAESWTTTFASEKNSILGIDSWEGHLTTNEDFQILKRFAKVFEQSYTRFLDLQKAEAQAREVQIEIALERMRSRTMAMQHSNELVEAANLMFHEVRGLGIPIWSCGYNIFEKNEKSCIGWMSTEGSIQPSFRIPLKVSQTFIKFYKSRQNGEELYEEKIGGADLETHYNYMFTLPDFADIIKNFLNSGYKLPTFQVNTVVNFSQGNLIFISAESIPEAHEIFRRFSKVFEQTYTRFLDLQKAETQAREAQIEVSFERIRASALAMQTSDEFLGVVKTLYEQINDLGQKELEATIIQFYDLEQGFINSWNAQNIDSASTTNISLGATCIPFDACRLTLEWLNAYKSSQEDYTIVAKDDILKEWLHLLVRLSPKIKDRLGDLMPQISNFHFSKFSEGALSMVSQKPFSEESKYLLKRAASAFDLAYKRYLDLQLKEEQSLKLSQEKQRLEIALNKLQTTQAQLIQKEKLASLGELTAGIAHEIQNPLNFVNNFSELSIELIEELGPQTPEGGFTNSPFGGWGAFFGDLAQNLEKINHHGKRASSIVKGMLEHSRTSSGTKELTDINKLADEYLRLSYHGLRAKDKSFNSDFELITDPNLPKVNVIPQDIGRVLLNLINNAFQSPSPQTPEGGLKGKKVTVKTFKIEASNEAPFGAAAVAGLGASIHDNGSGIPADILPKIFQPFFTTKPTGQGTGLGLSLAYDIVTKGHGGTLDVESIEGEGTTFTVKLPI